jgi:hypothetical protein
MAKEVAKLEYPKALYHEDGTHIVVKNPEEHKAAGKGYYEHPDDAKDAAEKKALAKPAAGGKPAGKGDSI